MLTALLVLFLVILTYLLTDLRHRNEIQDIKAAHAAELNWVAVCAYDSGRKYGARTARSKTAQMPMHTSN